MSAVAIDFGGARPIAQPKPLRPRLDQPFDDPPDADFDFTKFFF